MNQLRAAKDRGSADYGWLQALYSFSFAGYYDPEYMGVSALRVINEDRIAPKMGFGMHGHQNMEIITYVMKGALAHRDSMGNSSTIFAGQVQKMSAGRGVRHSEFNASEFEQTHLLQIWIEPNVQGIEPEYQQDALVEMPLWQGWRVIAAPKGEWHGVSGAFRLYQDAVLLAAHTADGADVRFHTLEESRVAYIHVATGSVTVGERVLCSGDALVVADVPEIQLKLAQGAQVLLFDLPQVTS